MPLLKSDPLDFISDALLDRGIDGAKFDLVKSENPGEDFDPEATLIRQTLNMNGASIEDASQTIADIMGQGKAPIRLKAAELVLDLHGIRDKDGKLKKQPIFNFHINNTQVNVAKIFAPHHARNTDVTIEVDRD